MLSSASQEEQTQHRCSEGIEESASSRGEGEEEREEGEEEREEGEEDIGKERKNEKSNC